MESFGDTCICKNHGLRRLMAFDFRKYSLPPIGLGDSEILIQEILRSGNTLYDKSLVKGRGWDFMCKSCGDILREHYDEFSINMSQSFVEYEGNIDGVVPYLTGYFGFDLAEIGKIKNYQKIENYREYLDFLKIESLDEILRDLNPSNK